MKKDSTGGQAGVFDDPAVASEFGFRPLYCPFISHVDKYYQSPGYNIQFFNCMGEKCQLWNKKKKDCGLLRNIEYETLLEKILDAKSIPKK